MLQALRVGVATRLIAGLVALTLLAGVASVVALVSFSQVERSFDRVASTHLGTMLLGSRLEQQSQALVGLAPLLLMKGLDEGELLAFTYAVYGRQSALEQLIVELGTFVDDDDDVALTKIRSISNELFTNLDALSTVLYAQASADAEANLALERFLTAYDMTIDSLEFVSAAAATKTEPAGEALAAGAADWLGILNDLSAAALKIDASEIPSSLDALEDRIRQLIKSADASSGPLVTELPELAGQQDAIEAALVGKTGLIASRRQIMEAQTQLRELMDRNDRVAASFTEAVDALIASIHEDVGEQNRRLDAMLTTRSRLLAGLAALGLLAAIVIGVYLQRSVIRRLNRLHQSMRDERPADSVADLARGRDEIADMAVSFRHFVTEIQRRDRELRQNQERLKNAIESIPEGFSLYDSDDRLVTSNRRYLSMLCPRMEGAGQAGDSFESILRRAAGNGLVAEAEGRLEDWVAERMATHRNPTDAVIQLRIGGRWIEIAERKTSDGDIVTVYADITERKNFETRLLEEKHRTEEANRALETLSRKLSKYLSPQLYASLFQGTHQAEIASRRKKLTIFFSDIADFTETVDSLESEEATALLNSYLNEMSRIALEFGATIDKYIGDAMLLFFGDPETKGPEEDARACVRMAVAMQKRMIELQAEWRGRGLERPFRMRIGINTGYCTVGNFGSDDRMDYTIIGNEVNLAARLQTHAELGGILLSHETYSLVRDTIPAEERAPVTVKGFARPVRNYAVIAEPQEVGAGNEVLRRTADGFRLEVDLDRLTGTQRQRAIEELQQILRLIRDNSGREAQGG